MSFIDDLKKILDSTSIPKKESEKVVIEVSKRYGGEFPYIRKKEGKSVVQQKQKKAP